MKIIETHKDMHMGQLNSFPKKSLFLDIASLKDLNIKPLVIIMVHPAIANKSKII